MPPRTAKRNTSLGPIQELVMRTIVQAATVAAFLLLPLGKATSQGVPPPTTSQPSPPFYAVERGVLFTVDDRSGPRLGVAYLAGGSVTAERLGRKFSPFT